MLCTSCCDCEVRSLSTTSTTMFFTSMFITHGITHIIMMGNTTMRRGRKALRRICKNSFCMRYFSVIGYSSRLLNLASATASNTAVKPVRMRVSRITSPSPTPMIMSLRMASI